VFVLWVNADGWFWLGLATVALVGLGQILDFTIRRDKEKADRRGKNLVFLSLRLLGSLFLLAAVCLLNPSHIYVFTLVPRSEWPGLPGAATAAPGVGQGISPFEPAYWTTLGRTPAGLAYFPLLGLGFLSFLLNLPRWHWRTFLPWLGLALLSAFQARTVPFFAVLAGPVLAWNLQELFARHSESERRQGLLWGHALLALRALTVVLGLAFLACAWPGWLQLPPFEPRRWVIETAPSLERGATAARRWHQDGRLGADARGLHLSAATAAAFAWFCPEDQGLWDEQLSAAILGEPDAQDDWHERIRSLGITHVIIYDPHRSRLLAALDRLLADPDHWPLLHLEGDLAIFGWRERAKAEAPDPYRGWELDLDHLAFHPAPDKKAPRKAPDREPGQRPWWNAFWEPASPRPIDRDEATLHLLHAEVVRRSAPVRHLTAWETTQSAALIGAAGTWIEPRSLIDAQLRLVLLRPPLPEQGSTERLPSSLSQLTLAWQVRFTQQRDDTYPALLYLAIRAARRALAVNPEDAEAYLVLGQSYLRLLADTRERAWGERLPELVKLRQAQASTALNLAVALKPDLAQAHLHLAWLYRATGCLDLALEHLRTYVKLIHTSGPSGGDRDGPVRETEMRYEEQANQLAQMVRDREESYTAAAVRVRILDRALIALQNGLAGKARDILLETDYAAFGPEGMALELELLLRTGRSRDVLKWLGPEQEAALGASASHSLRVRALTALGDYALAQEELTRASGEQSRGLRFRDMMALMVGKGVLDASPAPESLPFRIWQTFLMTQVNNRVSVMAQNMRQEADLSVLGGLVALEEGDVDEAEVAFRLALAWWKDKAAAASGSGLDFRGRVIAQECLEWLGNRF
jgi:hypothetical protein